MNNLAKLSLLLASVVFAVEAFAVPAPDLPPDRETDPDGYEAWNKELNEREQERHERYYNVYPVLDFAYTFQRDWTAATSSMHRFDLWGGLRVPHTEPSRLANAYQGITLGAGGLLELGDARGRSGRRSGLLIRAAYEWEAGAAIPFVAMGAHPQSVREEFPWQRVSATQAGGGIELGIVENKHIGLGGTEGVLRVGANLSGGFFLWSLRAGYAVEFYDDDKARDLYATFCFGRPLVPFGLTFGYRRLSIGRFTADYFTFGVELSI